MIKKLFSILLLSSFSITCLASTWPVISLNESGCSAITKGNLTACFLNNTSGHLDEYMLKQTFIYENGEAFEMVSDLGAMQPNNFAVMSYSSIDFAKSKISAVWFSISKGDALSYRVIPGCTIEFTPNSISKSVISIIKIKDNLYCK